NGDQVAQNLYYVAGVDGTDRSKLCSDARRRSVMGISSDGHPRIDLWYAFFDNPGSICQGISEPGGTATNYRYNVVGGGPQINYGGQFRWDTTDSCPTEHM